MFKLQLLIFFLAYLKVNNIAVSFFFSTTSNMESTVKYLVDSMNDISNIFDGVCIPRDIDIMTIPHNVSDITSPVFDNDYILYNIKKSINSHKERLNNTWTQSPFYERIDIITSVPEATEYLTDEFFNETSMPTHKTYVSFWTAKGYVCPLCVNWERFTPGVYEHRRYLYFVIHTIAEQLMLLDLPPTNKHVIYSYLVDFSTLLLSLADHIDITTGFWNEAKNLAYQGSTLRNLHTGWIEPSPGK